MKYLQPRPRPVTAVKLHARCKVLRGFLKYLGILKEHKWVRISWYENNRSTIPKFLHYFLVVRWKTKQVEHPFTATNSVASHLLKRSDPSIMIPLGHGFSDENNGGRAVHIDFWNGGWKNWWSVYLNRNSLDHKPSSCLRIWETKRFRHLCVSTIPGHARPKIPNKLWSSNGRYGKYSYHDPTQKENSYIGSATGLSFTEQPPKSM